MRKRTFTSRTKCAEQRKCFNQSNPISLGLRVICALVSPTPLPLTPAPDTQHGQLSHGMMFKLGILRGWLTPGAHVPGA